MNSFRFPTWAYWKYITPMGIVRHKLRNIIWSWFTRQYHSFKYYCSSRLVQPDSTNLGRGQPDNDNAKYVSSLAHGFRDKYYVFKNFLYICIVITTVLNNNNSNVLNSHNTQLEVSTKSKRLKTLLLHRWENVIHNYARTVMNQIGWQRYRIS